MESTGGSSRGEVSIADALSQIEGNVKGRSEGFANLKHVLRHNQGNPKLGRLNDKYFHKVFEVLFRVASAERSAYLKSLDSTSKTVRSASATRLTSCASTLRLAVDVGLRKIRARTVAALLDHILDTLLDANGECCEPLALDYVRCLSALLSYEPHVEHLKKSQWEEVTAFCLARIQSANSQAAVNALVGTDRAASSSSRLSVRLSHTLSRSSQAAKTAGLLPKQVLDEFVTSLKHLTSAPFAPLLEKSKAILSAVLDSFRASSSMTQSQVNALVILNNTLQQVRTEDIGLTDTVTRDCIQVARQLWSSKLVSIKDEVLVLLVMLHPYIKKQSQTFEDPLFAGELESLVETLRTEYARRDVKDQLQLDDLALQLSPDHNNDHLSLQTCKLRDGLVAATNSPTAEHNWTLLRLLAFFSSIRIDHQRPALDGSELGNLDRSKRQRLSHWSDELLRLLYDPHPATRICSLQSICFNAQSMVFDEDLLEHIVERLSTYINDDNGVLASWALQSLASSATQSAATSENLAKYWVSIWTMTTRIVNSSQTARAACHLLDVMIKTKLVDRLTSLETFSSMASSLEINGPSIFCDSSTQLLLTLIDQLEGESITASKNIPERVLTWLFRTWAPGNFHDKSFAVQHTQVGVEDQLHLLSKCLGWSPPLGSIQVIPVWGQIAQSWKAHERNQDFLSYLLLEEQSHRYKAHIATESTTLSARPSFSSSSANVSLAIGLCISETTRAIEHLEMAKDQRGGNVNRDMTRMLCTLVIVGLYMSTYHPTEDSHRAAQLRTVNERLMDRFFRDLSNTDCEQNKIDAVVGVLAHNMTATASEPDTYMERAYLQTFCARLTKLLDARRVASQLEGAARENANYDDLMDMDTEFDSQVAVRSDRTSNLALPRRFIASTHDIQTQRACVALYAKLMLYSPHVEEKDMMEGSASSAIVDYLVSLDPPTVLASRPTVAALCDYGYQLASDDVERLFGFLSDEFLQSYEHERSETILSLLLDVMIGHIEVWTDPSGKDVYDFGVDLYKWLTVTALDGKMLPVTAQKRLAKLLLQILQIDADYAHGQGVPSVRTTLFRVLSEGNLEVKYFLAEHISDIFGLFTLSTHDAVFEDLSSSLPTDAEWIEGIAIRTFVLGNIASRWHSLLRRCIYHIFETAGLVARSASYATSCIHTTAQSLGLGNAQDLFKLFSPQLLFTWLETRTLEKIPFAIFGYNTLADLLQHNLDEVYSQLVIRNRSEEIQWLAKHLRTTTDQMLRTCFKRAAAFAMSWDVCFAQGGEPHCETRLKEQLKSKNDYYAAIQENFPAIMAQMFISAHQDQLVDKALEKQPRYQYASSALKTMKTFGSSDRPLPATQQPHFKGRYLIDQLERLCRRAFRTDIETVASVLDQSSLTIILRLILDDLHPAFGPLHACQVVRKLRLLIAFSGDVILDGYSLEMLLRALRPLTVDSQCADDAIGVLQYLFHRGKPYLEKDMSMLTGNALLVVLSLKRFMASRQDKTTQESQFRSTVSKMHALHDWLLDYVHSCQSSLRDKGDVAKAVFLRLVDVCRDLTLPGSAEMGNPASVMLQILLDDEQGNGSIFRVQERRQIISQLCQSFERPPSRSRDAFGNDEASVVYAKRILESARAFAGAEQYEMWTARVLGRAYVSTVSLKFADPSRRLLPNVSEDSTKPLQSQHAIAAKLQDLLLSEHNNHAGTSERTLRQVLSRFEYAKEGVRDHKGLTDFQSFLPLHVITAMSIGHVEKKETLALGRSSLVSKAWKDELDLAAKVKPNVELEDWIQILTLTICRWTEDDPVVGSLIDLITVIKESARQLFPFILHLALKVEIEKEQVIRTIMSGSFNSHFRDCKINVQSRQKSRLMLGALLHFLTQQFPSERTRMDRLNWLDIDYLLASQAAAWCGMSTTALYFAEIATTPVTSNRSTRRTSVSPSVARKPSDELLLSIYRKIDDPDSFYGVQQEASLQSVLDRVDHERDGLKGIMLHTARMDASMLRLGEVGESDSSGVIKSVGAMNLSSLTHDLLTKRRGQHLDNETMSTMLDAARKLGQWNISPPQTFETDTSMLYSIFRGLSAASDLKKFRMDLDHALKFSVRKLQDPQLDIISARSTLSALGVLTEVDEMISVTGSADLAALWETMQTRQSGWDIGRLHDAKQMMSYRESLFGILSRSTRLREALHVSLRDCRLIEVKAVISGSEFARKNDEIQQSLTAATYLSELLPICDDLGLKIDAAAHFEAASILWKQNEISSSVQILQGIRSRTDLETQAVKVGSAGLLAQLGHEVASARLEKPEDVISRYLRPAIAQLGKSSDRSETGRVYFEFASFCDQQLQSAGNIADFQRLAKISERRKAELRQYEEMLKDTRSSQKAQQRSTKLAAQRAQQWYKLDNEEYQRAKRSRDEFVQQALENYLNALKHCDDFNTCVVRFFSLWLEYSDSESANTAVSKPLVQVPSWKFIGLMNQLTSRLLKDGSLFQRFLTELVRRMCSEHPYHTVHDIFASCNSTISDTDTAAKMRKDAAVDIKLSLQDDKRVGNMCTRIFNAGVAYHKLAMTRVEAVTGKRYFLSTVRVAAEMDAKVRKLGVPPATLHLDLRPNANYKDVPTITRFRSEIKIANGLSAPKVLIAQGSDGKEYRQLFKGGNDDLRQDAIMEQVFEEVSKMLQKHKTTRQRNLHIRTYKVLPLSSTSGIIEFVPNSLPLADFLIPAHGKYHPSDLSNAKCREIIANASRLTKEQRYKEYKGVTEKFQPVLRHFFLERFEDPDEWFERRLAYSRSTAAISMLGYVLGLGDRHTHNILLDEKSGEVIHIDLGVAFEAGRVLPIPEVVPFRMTRDIVDGMGITKTEGVFRRCCEFTMDALREETDGIMTLLNVLRYDPLYSWTLSPIRAKRMQAAQEETESKAEGKAEGKLEAAKSNTGEDEGGEAERALSVVEKKLSKTLSTVATVNELIQQATDERNLAVLFAGWSAYA